MYSPQQSRYRIGAHGSNSGNFSDGAGPTATRCYEPHWEWNSNRNEWIFRIAQPVIGLDGGSYTNSGYFYQDISNNDVLDDNNMGILFEKKYKFRTINTTRRVDS